MLKKQIQDDMKACMKAGEKAKLATIRLVLAAIKQREVDTREEQTDEAVLAVLDKMVKQRRDSIKQYQDAGRQELADQEQSEIEVIQGYLPTPLGDEEISAMIDEAIAATGAESAKEMGKVIGQLKAKMQGRADMGKVSGLVKAKLS